MFGLIDEVLTMFDVTNVRLAGLVVAGMLWVTSAYATDLDLEALRRAVDCLNTDTSLEFEDAPISEVLDHLAVREGLRFRVESPALTRSGCSSA